ncbi:TPA: phage tail protein [Escherichia coli]|nr:phage tail protein [Escherichia coli]
MVSNDSPGYTPHPFVRPAFDVRSEQAAQVAIARMNRAIDEVLRR